MSMETWEREFCPVPAKVAARKSKLEMVKRDLKKWRGLTKKNLAKHGIRSKGKFIADEERYTFGIDGTTCALCQRFLSDCRECPLHIVRGVRCDVKRLRELTTPYYWFVGRGNPRRMIHWLEKAKKMLEDSE